MRAQCFANALPQATFTPAIPSFRPASFFPRRNARDARPAGFLAPKLSADTGAPPHGTPSRRPNAPPASDKCEFGATNSLPTTNSAPSEVSDGFALFGKVHSNRI